MLKAFERTRTESCLSDLTLDWLAAAELDAAAAAQAQDHLRGCAACAARRLELEAGRDAYRAARPIFLRPRRRRRYLVPGGALAAAAAVLLFFALRPEPVLRTKGSDRLGFYVKRGDRVWRGRARETLHAGDALRFDLAGSEGRFVAVLSRDGSGRTSVYFPTRPRAVLVPEGPLPASTILDAELGEEQLFGLFCDRAEELEPLRLALERTGTLAPPEGCDIDAVTVDKRAP